MKRLLTTLMGCLFILNGLVVMAQPVEVTVQLRGVYDSKITVSPFDGTKLVDPLRIRNGVKSGESVTFEVPGEYLPGEFLLRFDYRAKEEDNPYPATLSVLLNRESIGIAVNPVYANVDSTRYTGDKENEAWHRFSVLNAQKNQSLALLEQLLGNYDHRSSAFYQTVEKEYAERCAAYNQWMDEMRTEEADLYVSHLFNFSRKYPVDWSLSPEQQLQQQGNHWFDHFNFKDTLVLRSREMNQFVNTYVGFWGQQITREELKDSLFTHAGRLVIDKAAREAHPKVYGWFVDYFFNGYETYDIENGMTMLEQHMNNPRCLTRKKQAIQTRLEGMKHMVVGVQSPAVRVENTEGKETTIDFSRGKMDYHLLVFYDADCGHCKALLEGLQTWYARPENATWIDIYSVSLDEDKDLWLSFHEEKKWPWMDSHAPRGINSQAAEKYYILSAPQMFVMDNDGVLVCKPSTVDELNEFLHGKQEE